MRGLGEMVVEETLEVVQGPVCVVLGVVGLGTEEKAGV
jgi:hypothetical protein